jgi:thioredoxin reductase
VKSEVAVIGAGPAGIAAAIQLKRYNIECLLFEKDRPGGLLKNANLVENYPGFPRGVTGPRMVTLLQEHLEAYKINVLNEEVEILEYQEEEKRFLIATPNAVYYSQTVVVASGTMPRELELVKKLPPQLRKNVLYEVHPIVREKGKRILIIGAGDAAFDYALNLAAENNVIISNRGEQVKAIPLLVERAAANPCIAYYKNTAVTKIVQGNAKELLVILSTPSTHDSPQEVETDYLVCATGRVPQTGFYTPSLTRMKEELRCQGVFYEIGDVINGIFRQAAIACGNGIQIAMKIHR